MILRKQRTFYLHIGASNHNFSFSNLLLKGGYGGGGDSMNSGPGGGATDLRLLSGAYEDHQGLLSRIMVAAGGGGSNDDNNGGDGGALIGQNGKTDTGKGGTQTAGGTGQVNGSLGIGGGSYYDGGGGGGGLYGGGQGTNFDHPGGGGSSYISGYNGCETHVSGRIFYNATMSRGGNKGNGYAIITRISSQSDDFSEWKIKLKLSPKLRTHGLSFIIGLLCCQAISTKNCNKKLIENNIESN